MAKANLSSVQMSSGLKLGFIASTMKNDGKGYTNQQHQEKGAVNSSKVISDAQKKKAKAKAKIAKQSRKKNK